MPNANRTVTVEGYDILATVVTDTGRVVVLNNNSNWLGICLQAQDHTPWSGGWSSLAIVRAEFSYGSEPFVATFRKALAAMTELAITDMSFEDDSSSDNEATPVDACPTCGCRPGDGRTAGCADEIGCGFAG